MEIVKPRWSSESFLTYAGAGTALVATFDLVDRLASGQAGRFLWEVIALVVAAGLALAFERNAWRIPAGLLAFVTVALFALAVSQLEEWIGWHPSANGFTFSRFLLLLLVMAAAVVAVRRFRFPLLTAIVGGVSWALVIEFFQSSGANWVATISILFGLALIGVALVVDTGSRPYGFWLHVVAGLTIGGSLLHFWHTTDLDFAWIAIFALLYIAVGSRWERSSYAVLGTLALAGSVTHFINDWAGSPLSVLSSILPFGSAGSSNSAPGWARPLLYTGFGLLLLVLGIVLERRRRPVER